MTLKYYLSLIGRWWWVWLISLALALASGYLYTQRQPRIYMSRTTLMVGQSIANPNPDPQYIGLARSLAQIYGDLAKRLPVTQPVIEKLGLKLTPDELAKRMETRVLFDAQLLEITVYDTDPQWAATIANAVAEELIRQSPSVDTENERFVRQQLDDLQSQIEKADADIKSLRSAILNMTSATEINEAQSRIRELEQLKRDNQSTYSQLLLSLNTNRPNTLRVMEPAIVPDQPVGPKLTLNVAIAGAIGLMLAVATIVFLEYMDDTIRWDGQIHSKVMGMPVLGAMPRLSSKDERLIAWGAPHSGAAELVRQLRTNIFLARPGGTTRVLLVTSPAPQDGKTLIAGNLAVSMASAGMRVVLVDTDLRIPMLHELFDLPNTRGLTELLSADRPDPFALEEVLLPTHVPNLMLLPAGRPPLDPMTLLASPRLPALLDGLRERADLIILDSPPVATMPDALILDALADATLLVVTAGGTSRRLLQAARNRLMEREGGRLPGLVFNYVSSGGLGGYGYTYRYYYYRPRERRRFGWFRRQPAPVTNGASSSNGAAGSAELAADRDGFVELEEAAAYLGISPATARRWCESGRLPATKQGRRWKVRRADLETMGRGG